MSLVPVVSTAAVAALICSLVLPSPQGRRATGSERLDETSTDDARTRFRLPKRRRAKRIAPSELASWADDLARSLRHGSTLRSSLATVLPDGDALLDFSATLRHRLDRGASVDNACDDWADELVLLEVGRSELLIAFAAVLGAAAALGGAASTPLHRFAATMRQHASDDLERRAQSAQATLSAWVLTLVPVAVLLVLLATDDDVRTVLASPTGAMVIAVGLLLNAIGAWWMRRIVGSTARGGRR
jgi:tight adherence protein B